MNRPETHGGDKRYTEVEELVADYESGALHPGDLKVVCVWVKASVDVG